MALSTTCSFFYSILLEYVGRRVQDWGHLYGGVTCRHRDHWAVEGCCGCSLPREGHVASCAHGHCPQSRAEVIAVYCCDRNVIKVIQVTTGGGQESRLGVGESFKILRQFCSSFRSFRFLIQNTGMDDPHRVYGARVAKNKATRDLLPWSGHHKCCHMIRFLPAKNILKLAALKCQVWFLVSCNPQKNTKNKCTNIVCVYIYICNYIYISWLYYICWQLLKHPSTAG